MNPTKHQKPQEKLKASHIPFTRAEFESALKRLGHVPIPVLLPLAADRAARDCFMRLMDPLTVTSAQNKRDFRMLYLYLSRLQDPGFVTFLEEQP